MLTALYDGQCPVCQASCARLRALDWRRRIAFIDLHEGEHWRGLCPDLALHELLGEIHVIDADGQRYAGFTASRRLLRELPLLWLPWLLLWLPGVDRLGAGLYRMVARRRYRLSRLLGIGRPGCPQACRMASEEGA